MKITAFQTPLIKPGEDLSEHVARAIPQLPEKSFLVIASKIVSTCENRLVPKQEGTREEKHQLVRQEAELYTEPGDSQYDIMLTIKRNWMFVNAGIDESNADNQYILWPVDPQQSLNQLWQWARDHYQVKELGLIMTDSTSIPLNWGVFGRGIAYCGFWPLKSYIGTPDLYGREMKMEQVSILQSVAAAAVLEMGEGAESTPLAVVEGVQQVEFQDHAPTTAELDELKIDLKDDVYAPLLMNVGWQKS
jgi:putative folate metabolism gamma-glutamate ligase